MLITTIVSKPLSQTIPIDRKDALKVYAGALKALVYDSIIKQQKTDIESLNKLIALKQTEINQYRSKDTLNDNIIRTYENEIQVMKDQRKLAEAILKSNDKLIKRYKRRVFFRTILGLAAVGTITYFYLVK